MAWGQLAVDKPHLVYIILGGFTSLFMLCSTVIKERLYIGEATVATVCGVIFGPHAANLIDPATWGNVDRITLEFSRIVLVVQCFAVGVELPRAYMERHWRSVVFLLVPVMTFGWIITSLFIWGLMRDRLNWLDSLVIAACVTATDPVLASSVVGKGKFAKRVPKHLRDVLSAESGCNDGMAFPFIYLALYLVQYHQKAGEVTWHWIGITILYECVFGAIYGVVVGYIARRAVRYAHEHDLIDRESFLVFYFVLALFCAGSGSMLGVDDLLVGFAAGVGFSNDGWFGEKTEESHVSNVIDLLINLAFFVYFGTIIPWGQYNSVMIGLSPWKLVVLAILVLLFRRIPIMMALKTVIPDVKTWREALFAGHFGPIGVGAIFVAILARAELETESTTPLAELPTTGEYLNIIQLIWPVTTFLVMASILVHGSSIAVFTLGKHINTLTITMSYTQAEIEGNWMDRLPRIQSRSKSTMSQRKPGDMSEESLGEKLPEYPAAALGLPRNFLRRQKEDETPSRSSSMSRRWKRDGGGRVGGPIEQSAISPMPRNEARPESEERSGSDTIGGKDEASQGQDEESNRGRKSNGRKTEVYEEGDDAIIEDEEGNVLDIVKSQPGESREEREERVEEDVREILSDGEHSRSPASNRKSPRHRQETPERRRSSLSERRESASLERRGSSQQNPEFAALRPTTTRSRTVRQLSSFLGMDKGSTTEAKPPQAERPKVHKSGPARAFRFGRTIIVEDEDGEVIKKYDIPAPERKGSMQGQNFANPERTKMRLRRMSTWLGVTNDEDDNAEAGPSGAARKQSKDDDDEGIRFTVDGQTTRMNKADFIRQIEAMHPQKRAQVVEQSDASEAVKREARADAKEHVNNRERAGYFDADIVEERLNPTTLSPVHTHDSDIPFHSFEQDLRGRETAAQRRRREAGESVIRSQGQQVQRPSATTRSTTSRTARPEQQRPLTTRESTSRVARSEQARPAATREATSRTSRTEQQQPQRLPTFHEAPRPARSDDNEEETAAERRRREAALGVTRESPSDSDDEETGTSRRPQYGRNEGSETAAEKRRRVAALGISREDSDSDSERVENRAEQLGSASASASATPAAASTSVETPAPVSQGIRFADPAPRGDAGGEKKAKSRWGMNRGRWS